MTLLSEYQALPAEPKFTMPQREKRLPYTCTTALCVGCGAQVHGDFGLVPDICTACEAQEHARFAGRQVERRDAIIRLLCRALDCAASDLERMEVATHDLRALLSAAERDFLGGA